MFPIVICLNWWPLLIIIVFKPSICAKFTKNFWLLDQFIFQIYWFFLTVLFFIIYIFYPVKVFAVFQMNIFFNVLLQDLIVKRYVQIDVGLGLKMCPCRGDSGSDTHRLLWVVDDWPRRVEETWSKEFWRWNVTVVGPEKDHVARLPQGYLEHYVVGSSRVTRYWIGQVDGPDEYVDSLGSGVQYHTAYSSASVWVALIELGWWVLFSGDVHVSRVHGGQLATPYWSWASGHRLLPPELKLLQFPTQEVIGCTGFSWARISLINFSVGGGMEGLLGQLAGLIFNGEGEVLSS